MQLQKEYEKLLKEFDEGHRLLKHKKKKLAELRKQIEAALKRKIIK